VPQFPKPKVHRFESCRDYIAASMETGAVTGRPKSHSRIALEIGARNEALGDHWCLPGSGPLSGRQVADIAERHLGRQVKVRSVGLTTLRIVSLFNKDLRGLLQVAPDYMKPVRYDARKLDSLLGPQQMTSYDVGIGQTPAWIGVALRSWSCFT
jgi:hypothetical protein